MPPAVSLAVSLAASLVASLAVVGLWSMGWAAPTAVDVVWSVALEGGGVPDTGTLVPGSGCVVCWVLLGGGVGGMVRVCRAYFSWWGRRVGLLLPWSSLAR